MLQITYCLIRFLVYSEISKLNRLVGFLFYGKINYVLINRYESNGYESKIFRQIYASVEPDDVHNVGTLKIRTAGFGPGEEVFNVVLRNERILNFKHSFL